MGYGFVEFSLKEEADKALKTLQFTNLDDHKIELKRSNRTTSLVFTLIFPILLLLLFLSIDSIAFLISVLQIQIRGTLIKNAKNRVRKY